MRKLTQLEGERDELASRLSKDQSWMVSNLLQKIRKLEAEIQNNHKVYIFICFIYFFNNVVFWTTNSLFPLGRPVAKKIF